MSTNRITRFFTESAQDSAETPRVGPQSLTGGTPLPADFIVIPPANVQFGVTPASLYDAARRAAIQGAREKLLALLRSRQGLIGGQE
jgi:hypothetical protein